MRIQNGPMPVAVGYCTWVTHTRFVTLSEAESVTKRRELEV
eukprot:COSAG02_NODE_7657_length_2908_cov_52.017958_1_plen_41_part_00